MDHGKFVFVLERPDGTELRLDYDPKCSRLTHEDGTPVDLSPVGHAYAPNPVHQPAPAFTSEAPVGKSRKVRHLKIMLGKACNYSCAYCSQASQRHTGTSKLDDVEAFLENLPTWWDGGEDGQGTGVKIELWGGEPFVYWKKLRRLVPALRERYPHANLFMFTNGSLLDDEKIEWIDRYGFAINISHDGPAQHLRGPDPFDDPKSAEAIKKLYWRFKPQGRISMAFVVNNQNYDFGKVRAWFAEKLGDPMPSVATAEFMDAHDAMGIMLSPQTEQEHRDLRDTLYRAFASMDGLPVPTVNMKITGWFSSLTFALPPSSIGQKCGMDRPGKLAVDLRGNVSTCQNVAAEGKHHLGNVADFDDIRLTSAWHWTERAECRNCPVLHSCAGGCMMQQKDSMEWKVSCDSAFSYNLAIVAAGLYFLTGAKLKRVEGDTIRRPGVTSVEF